MIAAEQYTAATEHTESTARPLAATKPVHQRLGCISAQADKPKGLEVKIVGPGCINCEKLEQMVYKVMSVANLLGTVERVRDLNEIAAYGLVPTPALVISGKVKSSGRLPPERQVLQWLGEAARG